MTRKSGPARRVRFGWAVVLAAVMGFAAEARAAVLYRYVPEAVGGLLGGGTQVNVYLEELRDVGDASVIAGDGGLFGSGFRFTRVGGGTWPIASVAGNSSVFGGLVSTTVSATSVSVLQSVSLEAIEGAMPDGSGRILLGTVTFAAGAMSGPTLFEVGRLDGIGGNTITFAGTDLDFDSAVPAFSGATGATPYFTIAVVPEPGAGMVLGGVGAAMLRRRRVVRPVAG